MCFVSLCRRGIKTMFTDTIVNHADIVGKMVWTGWGIRWNRIKIYRPGCQYCLQVPNLQFRSVYLQVQYYTFCEGVLTPTEVFKQVNWFGCVMIARTSPPLYRYQIPVDSWPVDNHRATRTHTFNPSPPLSHFNNQANNSLDIKAIKSPPYEK